MLSLFRCNNAPLNVTDSKYLAYLLKEWDVNGDSVITMKEAQRVAIKIPDENFQAYLLENFDKNKDGYISLYEANLVKAIDCHGKEIADLTGIERFYALESLDCSSNKLDELELRYNKRLNRLVCTGNNKPLTIYIGMSSPLRNPSVRRPADNSQPDLNSMVLPIDPSKCVYDRNDTNIMLMYDE